MEAILRQAGIALGTAVASLLLVFLLQAAFDLAGLLGERRRRRP